MKKRLVCITLVILFAFSFSGCVGPTLTHPKDYYGEREVGDFLVFFDSDDTCAVMGTTEQGNTKRFLIIPQQIEDSLVDTFGKPKIMGVSEPTIESDVLEKVFVESEEMSFFSLWYKTYCPNFKKIVCLKECAHEPRIESTIWDTFFYYPRYISEKYSSGYSFHLNPANVSYDYNYEGAENNGYYWVDDCDYGGKIEFIPEDPEREGYEFGGWYKEADCINKWDFEADTLPEEVTQSGETIENGEMIPTVEVVYQETILYAKWILKS